MARSVTPPPSRRKAVPRTPEKKRVPRRLRRPFWRRASAHFREAILTQDGRLLTRFTFRLLPPWVLIPPDLQLRIPRHLLEWHVPIDLWEEVGTLEIESGQNHRTAALLPAV